MPSNLIVTTTTQAVTPAAGDINYAQAQADVCSFYGLQDDPDKLALAGRLIREAIDDLNRRQVWLFNLVAAPNITTVPGTATYAIPADFWKTYNVRRTDGIDYQLTTVTRKTIDTQFQSQLQISGNPYVMVLTDTFRDGTINLFPAPDGSYTILLRYFKLIAKPSAPGDLLDMPQPYQTIPIYSARSRMGLLANQIAAAREWKAEFEQAYKEMERSDEEGGDEDLRFTNIEEILSRSINFLNPAARPRAYDLF